MSRKSIEQLIRDSQLLAAEVERSLSRSQCSTFEQFPELSSQDQDHIMRAAQAMVDQDLQDIERELSLLSEALTHPESVPPARKRTTVKRNKMI